MMVVVVVHNRVIDHPATIIMVRVLITIPKIASTVETMVGMLILLLVRLLSPVSVDDLGGTMANRVRVVVTNLARVVAASGRVEAIRGGVVPVAVANLARAGAMVVGVVASRAKHKL